jgi:hypothetical protein
VAKDVGREVRREMGREGGREELSRRAKENTKGSVKRKWKLEGESESGKLKWEEQQKGRREGMESKVRVYISQKSDVSQYWYKT